MPGFRRRLGHLPAPSGPASISAGIAELKPDDDGVSLFERADGRWSCTDARVPPRLVRETPCARSCSVLFLGRLGRSVLDGQLFLECEPERRQVDIAVADLLERRKQFLGLGGEHR